MADFFDENPYLRRYQLTPEQQQAYGRYLLARMRIGTDSPIGPAAGPGATSAGMRPDGVRMLPNPVATAVLPPTSDADGMKGGGQATTDDSTAAQSLSPLAVGGTVSEEGSPQLVQNDGRSETAVVPVQYRRPSFGGLLPRPAPSPSAADMFLDVARDIGGAIGDAYTTANNYRITQTAKGAGAFVGMPRVTADFVDWVQKKTGLPPVAFGPLAVLPALKKYLPEGDEVSRRLLDSEAKWRPGFKETTVHPIIDAGVQSLFLSPGLGVAGKLSPAFSFLTGAGSEAARQAAHDHDQQRGTSWEAPTRFLGNLIGSLF